MPRLRRALRRVSWSLAAFALVGITTALPLTVAWQQAGSLGDIAASASWSESLSSHAGTSALLAAAGLVAVLLATPYAAKTAIRANPASIAAAIGAVVALGSLPWVGHTRTYGPQWLVVGCRPRPRARSSIMDRLHHRPRPHPVAVVRCVDHAVGSHRRPVLGHGGLDGHRTHPGRRHDGLADPRLTRRTLGDVVRQGVDRQALHRGRGLALAGWNRLALLPRVEADGNDRSARRLLTRSLQLEAVSLVAVLVATSVLVTQSPGDTGSSLEAGTTERARGIETELGDGAGLVRLRMSPLVAGRNVVQVYLRDREGEPLRVLGAPSVRFRLDS